MIDAKYIDLIRQEVRHYFPNDKKVKAFIFGSSLTKKTFRDVDVGLIGIDEADKTGITKLRFAIEESTLPYIVDFVDFNTVTEQFKKTAFTDKVFWI